jgi:hypothetical protein
VASLGENRRSYWSRWLRLRPFSALVEPRTHAVSMLYDWRLSEADADTGHKRSAKDGLLATTTDAQAFKKTFPKMIQSREQTFHGEKARQDESHICE